MEESMASLEMSCLVHVPLSQRIQQRQSQGLTTSCHLGQACRASVQCIGIRVQQALGGWMGCQGMSRGAPAQQCQSDIKYESIF